MPDNTYKWMQMFGIQAPREDGLSVGDTVTVVAASGDSKRVNIIATWDFTSKAGKEFTRAAVEDAY